jgi:hypothetical protein
MMTAPVLSEKEIVCPYCYLATRITLSTEPRVPAPTMLWLCAECKDLSVFDDKLDLAIATDEQKKQALPVAGLDR